MSDHDTDRPEVSLYLFSLSQTQISMSIGNGHGTRSSYRIVLLLVEIPEPFRKQTGPKKRW